MSHIEHRTDHGPQEPDGARRQTLARLAAFCGLALGDFALSSDVLAAATTATTKAATKAAAPEYLSPDELALTGVLAELIIPQTDTPGALAVDAHRTVDHLLAVCALQPAQDAFRSGLARIDAVARAGDGKPFAALSPLRQASLLRAIDSGAAPFHAGDQRFFRQLKGYVAFAYYTSEAGASRELAYLPVPGGFIGHLKVTSATHTWAI
ncbi:gluconate 2-dehydrogenase subunit 3 family protein [Massilia sp. TN1-12]|uniref:gluconate 2-dehydrogenase subunit 3 family protein n=1 Tax=Massilia paldalensis TaxID=3377675 RepID=UPI00384EED5A